MRRRKVVAALAVAALGLGALAACGKDKTEAGGDKELTYWSMWKPGEDQQKVLQAAIEEFEKSTGIKVTVQWSGRDVLKQVAARLNAGDPPDLTDQDAGALQGNLGRPQRRPCSRQAMQSNGPSPYGHAARCRCSFVTLMPSENTCR